MDSYVAELPPILDSFFTGYTNTTSIPIGVEGEGWWGAMKWWVKGTCKLRTAKWHQLVLVSAPHNAQNSYIHSQPHQPVVW